MSGPSVVDEATGKRSWRFAELPEILAAQIFCGVDLRIFYRGSTCYHRLPAGEMLALAHRPRSSTTALDLLVELTSCGEPYHFKALVRDGPGHSLEDVAPPGSLITSSNPSTVDGAAPVGNSACAAVRNTDVNSASDKDRTHMTSCALEPVQKVCIRHHSDPLRMVSCVVDSAANLPADCFSHNESVCSPHADHQPRQSFIRTSLCCRRSRCSSNKFNTARRQSDGKELQASRQISTDSVSYQQMLWRQCQWFLPRGIAKFNSKCRFCPNRLLFFGLRCPVSRVCQIPAHNLECIGQAAASGSCSKNLGGALPPSMPAGV